MLPLIFLYGWLIDLQVWLLAVLYQKTEEACYLIIVRSMRISLTDICSVAAELNTSRPYTLKFKAWSAISLYKWSGKFKKTSIRSPWITFVRSSKSTSPLMWPCLKILWSPQGSPLLLLSPYIWRLPAKKKFLWFSRIYSCKALNSLATGSIKKVQANKLPSWVAMLNEPFSRALSISCYSTRSSSFWDRLKNDWFMGKFCV